MEKKKFNLKKEDFIIYAIILLSVLLFWIPFFSKGLPNGYEIGFHYTRIATLAESLQQGIFPAKLRPMHMKMYGYGVGFFYPDFFIYPMAVLIALGADSEIVIKLCEFIVVLVGSVVTYRCFFKMTGNKMVALFGEIIFLGSRINYDNFIVGGGVPHLYAYFFIPLTLLGLIEAFRGEKNGYIKYFIGLTGTVLSHHLIFVTMLLAIFIIAIVHFREIISNVKEFLKILGLSLVAVFLTTAYWLPAFEQAFNVKLGVLYDNAYDITENILSFHELYSIHIGPFLYIAFILSAIIFLFMMIKGYKLGVGIYSLFFVNVIILFITCSKMLWLSPIGKFLAFFQYTERFIFTLTATMIIFVVMIIGRVCEIDEIKNKISNIRGKEIILYVFMVLMILVTRFDNKADFYDINSYSKIVCTNKMYEDDYQVSFGEWLPMECEPSECKTPNTSYSDDGGSAEGFKHDRAKYYEVWVEFSKQYYDVPYIYYYGYKAYIVDENLNPIEELKVGEAIDNNGYVRVYMPEDRSDVGHILVTYRKTTIQIISYAISALCTVAIAVYVAIDMVKKRKMAKF